MFYSANSYLVREGGPVEEMLIVTRGKLISVSCEIESHGNYNSCYLEEGDMCGELLFGIMNQNSGSRLPTSARTVMTLTDVEGFILLPDDLKFVASHINHVQLMRFGHVFRQGLETRVAFEVFFPTINKTSNFPFVLVSGSAHSHGDDGEHASYRQHGGHIAKGSFVRS